MSMKSDFRIVVFEGDGIGPEIMVPTVEILNRMQSKNENYSLEFEAHQAGALYYSEAGESLPSASLEAARQSDAILLSAMGLPDVRYPDGNRNIASN